MADRKLTVVQTLPAMESGGVEQGTLEIAQELVRRGHRSIVISADGRMVPRLLEAGSEHITWNIGAKNPLTLRYIPKLRHFLRREKVDIVHARSRLPAWIAYLAWRSMPKNNRPRFITTVHGLYSVKYYSSIMTKGEKVIAVSDTVRNYIFENYPKTPKENVVTIYRGVDPKKYHPGYRPSDEWLANWYQQFPETMGKRLLLLPGRLTRLKGHFDFLELIERLIDEYPDIHGLIVGGEDPKRHGYAQSVRQHISDHRLRSYVTLTGVRDDLREIMAISNIVYSLSSHPESFGRTTLEALSLGTQVIGFRHGGVGELLSSFITQTPDHTLDQPDILKETHAQLNHPQTPLPNEQYTLEKMITASISMYTQTPSNHERS